MSNEPPNWTPICPKCGGVWDMMGCDCPVPKIPTPNEARIEALKYIDGWIDNKFCMPLVPAAKAMLDEMRIHIRAAVHRIESGERMEATTPVNND